MQSCIRGREIIDLRGLSGPLLPQNPFGKVGGEVFQWVFGKDGAAKTPQIDEFRPGSFIA